VNNGHGRAKSTPFSFKTIPLHELGFQILLIALTFWSYQAWTAQPRPAHRTPGFSTPPLAAPETLEQVERFKGEALDPAYQAHEKQWAESVAGNSAPILQK
jgi:hypothetical protein